jgi:hypothetical protein
MAIQPIDLQTMYSQLANVAQSVAHAQEGPQLAEAMQQENIVQKNKEQADKVQQTAAEGVKTAVIKDEGHSGTKSGAYGKKQKKPEDKKQETAPEDDGIRESYLGQHINITR